jgi:hypothetical protein
VPDVARLAELPAGVGAELVWSSSARASALPKFTDAVGLPGWEPENSGACSVDPPARSGSAWDEGMIGGLGRSR